MRKLIGAAAVTAVAALSPGVAQAMSSYLHLSEARSMQTRLARQEYGIIKASDVSKGACTRVDAHRFRCPVTYHRTNDGVYETCHFVVRVHKRHHGPNATLIRGRIDGFCGQEDGS